MTLEDHLVHLMGRFEAVDLETAVFKTAYGLTLEVNGTKFSVNGNTVEPLTEPIPKKEGVQ